MMKTLNRTSPELQKNTNKMEEQVMTEQEQGQMYQWVKGDRFGDVVTVDSNKSDAKFMYFTDGSRIIKNMAQEYLMAVRNENEILQVASDAKEVDTPTQNQITTNQDNSPSNVITEEEAVKEPTVMGKMIMKMSKKNVVNVPIQINVNIPTPALYAMLSEGMEEEDLNEEIMEVALQQIEINNLAEYLKENISTFLSEYYS